MPRPYFENDENWAKLQSEMEEWKGTPYRHLAMAKGRGADCTLFIGGSWKACGLLDAVTFDYYPEDWHVHTKEEMVLESIIRHYQDHCCDGIQMERFGPMEKEDMIRGDILAFNYPARNIFVSHHAAVWIGTIIKTRQRNLMINSIEGKGVIIMQYGTFWKNRLTNVFRAMEG